jgi:hypothetical protein
MLTLPGKIQKKQALINDQCLFYYCSFCFPVMELPCQVAEYYLLNRNILYFD